VSILTLLIVACVLCLVIWLARTYLPAPMNTIVTVVVVLIVIVWLLSMVLPLGGSLPRLR
jgi:hypothetical protein